MSVPLTRRSVAYIRVSTEEQATEGYSLSDQERQCRRYAEARDWPAVAEVYADAGVSGATRERPALKRLLIDARAGTVGRVICTKLDRMGRRAADVLAIEDELDNYSVERVYIKDSIDTSSPTGRLLRTVLAAVAELERDMILERTKAGHLEKARRGDIWRPRTPYGYRYIPADKHAGTPGRLEIEPETAPIIQRIFADIASGVSASALAVALTQEGVPTGQNGRVWYHATVCAIIRNPIYIGRAAYGRRRAVSRHGKRSSRPNDPAQVLYIDVPAIVSEALAASAQARLKTNRTLSPRNTKHPYLLGGGLLHCAHCGHVMSGIDHRGLWYRCQYTRPTGQHGHHRISVLAIEEAIRQTLIKLLRDPSRVLNNVRALAQTGSVQARKLEAEVARLERAGDDVESELSRLLDLYLKGKVTEDRYTAKAAELTQKRTVLYEQAATLAAHRDAALADVVPVDDAEAACQEIAEGIEALTPEEWREVVREIVFDVIATAEHALIKGYLPQRRAAGAPRRPLAREFVESTSE